MNIELIYHNNESMSGGVSPFDRVIKEMVRQQDIQIVCPFIGLDYFEGIINLANSWRLITDIQEWLFSQNKKDRERVIDFIKSNHKNIHYFKNVHAKVIITGEKVFFGSANLTRTGVTEKIEMSVVITDNNKVSEITKWFNDLWDDSDLIDIEGLEQFLKQNLSVPDLSMCKPKGSLPARSPINNSKLASSYNEEYNPFKIQDHMTDHEELVRCLKEYPNKDWINSYFDLVKEIIDFTSLKNEDERLVMSIRKSFKLPVTINQRYVLRCTPKGEVGLIMPLEYDSESNFVKDGVLEEDKKYYFRNKIQEARWVNFNRLDGIVFSPEVKQLWKQAVLVELNRGIKSGHRRAHKSVFYKAVNNLEYRRMLLDMAFSK